MLRRSEADVAGMYGYLSDMMRAASGGDMLNFGLWDGEEAPLGAQESLCRRLGRAARLGPGLRVVDAGSGYGAAAALWESEHGPLDISCLNITRGHLLGAPAAAGSRIGASATRMPLRAGSADRVIACESAQHFRPIEAFVGESHRVLSDGGILALAIPVAAGGPLMRAKLGILSLTWASEHYTKERVLGALEGFTVLECTEVGPSVYVPLADYYEANRKEIARRILPRYPRHIERVLAASMKKMKSAALAGDIGYMIVSCAKAGPARKGN
ncbi:SAM dependent methyltransferase [Cenarchaeum symbiosum A]|uniref:SAM dependent methyltransferase n=1 Tax=Cenarchaeum symbiosum (strain A) TaxID=414004 RepID=A0RW48_CENSY|nr:SAM dependent methyltransferase [Cenarchaeum symbiosum A]